MVYEASDECLAYSEAEPGRRGDRKRTEVRDEGCGEAREDETCHRCYLQGDDRNDKDAGDSGKGGTKCPVEYSDLIRRYPNG